MGSDKNNLGCTCLVLAICNTTLWRVRGWLDSAAGGPGLRRGKRDPDGLRHGATVDFWRVVGLDRDRSLSLRAEMRLSGEALLDFRIETTDGKRCLLGRPPCSSPRDIGIPLLARRYAISQHRLRELADGDSA